MSTYIIVVFAGGQQRTDKERSIPPDTQGQHVAAHALDESQDKTCARVSPLMHLTDSLGLLPERLLQDVKMGRKGRPTCENDPLHAPCDWSPLPRVLTCKGEMANSETFCSTFKKEAKKLKKPSQTHTEVIALLTALLLREMNTGWGFYLHPQERSSRGPFLSSAREGPSYLPLSV